MQFSVRSLLLTVLAGAIVGPAVAQQSPAPTGVPTTTAGTPKFQPEPFWPKPLPGNWILGQVAGLAVSPDNRIWIVQDADPVGSPRPPAGTVQVGAQHRHRLARQPVHCRGWLRSPRAEVQADGVSPAATQKIATAEGTLEGHGRL